MVKRIFLIMLSFACLLVLFQSVPRPEAGVGVVTGVRGQATVRRDAVPQPQTLKFKDELFWLDTLNTGEDSRLRIFILEQSVINMKENTQLQLREEAVSPTQPKKKSIINLLSGSVRVVVEKEALKDTDYEIRTGRAVAAIRGSSVIPIIGTAMNERFKTQRLPPIAQECVAFITGPGSHLGVNDAKLGPAQLDPLGLLVACDQFTHTPISEQQFDGLSTFFQSENANHIPPPSFS
jgi:hypothetical protein